MKVTTVLGTRPEIIRLSRVMPALDRAVEHVIVHTGQNHDYELNQVFFEDLELRRPDRFLDAAGATACETIGAIIARTDALLAEVRPDALLVLGDTNSCLAAYPAKRRRIPVFHMEAGNRCFDQRVPEETNRRIVDHISDVNLPYSSIAREYLLREGLPPDRVIKTGSPMFEVLQHYRAKADASGVLARLGLKAGGYYVVSAHREENIDLPGRFALLADVLNRLAAEGGLPVIVTTHPRTRKRMESERIPFDDRVRFEKPLGLTDYLHLQMHAACTLSDSGTITEESSILGFPAINIRDAHERPEGMEEAAVMMTGLRWETVCAALHVLRSGPGGRPPPVRLPADYQAPDVSAKVVRIVLSYTGYVNRTVWGTR
jgi:UDP-N-acetylglucosamine 2-epimerase (non-hydrolysing)